MSLRVNFAAAFVPRDFATTVAESAPIPTCTTSASGRSDCVVATGRARLSSFEGNAVEVMVAAGIQRRRAATAGFSLSSVKIAQRARMACRMHRRSVMDAHPQPALRELSCTDVTAAPDLTALGRNAADARRLRQLSLLNLTKMGHCAPTVMQTVLDLTGVKSDRLVRLSAGLPGGIGNIQQARVSSCRAMARCVGAEVRAMLADAGELPRHRDHETRGG